MGLSVKVDPIDRDIDLILRSDLSPAAASKTFAVFAREQLADAEQQNRQVLGAVPPHETFVDGVPGASEDQVKPDGTIVYEFELVNDVLDYIQTALQQHSPVRSGLYAKSHELFADGEQVDNPNAPPPASEYVFLNAQPYARKIERGLSPQAPEGVYEAVAAMANARFSNVAKVRFSYRSAVGLPGIGDWAKTGSAKALARRKKARSHPENWLTRQPAIVVTVR